MASSPRRAGAARARPKAASVQADANRPGRLPAQQARRSPASLTAIRDRLAAAQPSLSPTHRRIATYILANAADVVHMSVTEVAERTESSEGSVVGLCQGLGASGFQHLKIALAQ